MQVEAVRQMSQQFVHRASVDEPLLSETTVNVAVRKSFRVVLYHRGDKQCKDTH